MRKFLLTQFFCSECQGELGVEYEAYVKQSGARKRDPGIKGRDEPTGANMVATNVYVKPCYNCLQPARDAEALAEKLKTLMNGGPK
jgi:hypothetical protein